MTYLATRPSVLYRSEDVDRYLNGAGGDDPVDTFNHFHHIPALSGPATLDSRSVSHISHITPKGDLYDTHGKVAFSASHPAPAPAPPGLQPYGASYLDLRTQSMVERQAAHTVPQIGALKTRSSVRGPNQVEYDMTLRAKDAQIQALSDSVLVLTAENDSLVQRSKAALESSAVLIEERDTAVATQESLRAELEEATQKHTTQIVEWDTTLKEQMELHRTEMRDMQESMKEAADSLKKMGDEVSHLKTDVETGRHMMVESESMVRHLHGVIDQQQGRLVSMQQDVATTNLNAERRIAEAQLHAQQAHQQQQQQQQQHYQLAPQPTPQTYHSYIEIDQTSPANRAYGAQPMQTMQTLPTQPSISPIPADAQGALEAAQSVFPVCQPLSVSEAQDSVATLRARVLQLEAKRATLKQRKVAQTVRDADSMRSYSAVESKASSPRRPPVEGRVYHSHAYMNHDTEFI